MSTSTDPPQSAPPRLAKAALQWFCAPRWQEEIEGDLEEQFHRRVQRMSLRWAQGFYWKDMLLFMRPYGSSSK